MNEKVKNRNRNKAYKKQTKKKDQKANNERDKTEWINLKKEMIEDLEEKLFETKNMKNKSMKMWTCKIYMWANA